MSFGCGYFPFTSCEYLFFHCRWMASHVVLHAHRLSVFLYCDVEQKGNCMTVYVIPYVLFCELFLSPSEVNSVNFTATLLLLQYLSVTQWLPHIVTVYLSHACLAPKDFLITAGLKVALLIKWLLENNFPFQSQDACPTMGRETQHLPFNSNNSTISFIKDLVVVVNLYFTVSPAPGDTPEQH